MEKLLFIPEAGVSYRHLEIAYLELSLEIPTIKKKLVPEVTFREKPLDHYNSIQLYVNTRDLILGAKYKARCCRLE